VGSASGYAQAATTGGDPFQAAALGALIGGASDAVSAGVGGQLEHLLLRNVYGVAIGPATQGIHTISGYAGSVAGGSIGGGLNAAAGGTNIGKGIGFGALGGLIGGSLGNVAGSGMNLSGLGRFQNSFGWEVIAGGAFDWSGDRLAQEVE
jgi:hypothetical protein